MYHLGQYYDKVARGGGTKKLVSGVVSVVVWGGEPTLLM